MARQSDETLTEALGERLRRLRHEAGLSQRELSEPGVSYAYISRVEAGVRVPSTKALRKIAPKLGVSATYLETGEGMPPILAAQEWVAWFSGTESCQEIAQELGEAAHIIAAFAWEALAVEFIEDEALSAS